MRYAPFLTLGAVLAVSVPAQTRTTSAEALAWLKKGNERFVSEHSESRPLGEGVRRTLAKGQHPLAIVWTCADSRVSPEHLFNAGLGEVFVVRTAGNACDAESLASVEYAAEHLDAPLLVIMGHDSCGAVKAALDDAKATPAIRHVLERIAPAVRRARKDGLDGDALLGGAVQENVYETVAQTQLRSPTLRELARLGRLQIVGARYHLATGEVEWLPERPVVAEAERTTVAKKPPTALPPHTALAMLQAGHRRYVTGSGGHQDLTQERRKSLAAGQSPIAVVVTCSDSRVAPEHVFDAGLGEVFVVRVAGNVLNDSVQASVEYAVEHLGASLVVWMGHESCGAVKAAVASGEHAKLSESMRRLLEKIAPAVERAKRTASGDEVLGAAIAQNVLRNVQELRKASGVVRELEETGKLGILPVVYRLESGDLQWLDEAGARRAASHGHTAEPSESAPAPAGETAAHGHKVPEPAAPESTGASVHDKHETSHDEAHATHGAEATKHGHDDAAEEHDATGHGVETHATVPAPAAKKAGTPLTLYGTLGISLLAATLGVVVIWSLQRKKKPADTTPAA